MAAKLTANTVLTHPQSMELVALTAGSDVPEWADGLVGDHLTTGSSDDDSGQVSKSPRRAPRKPASASSD